MDSAEHDLRRRLGVFTRIHRELAKLRQAETVEAIVSRAPQAACDACGLDRAIIYRVRGNDMYAEAAFVRDDPVFAVEFVEWSQANPGPLQDRILESEMVRRRIPLLVLDAFNHPDTHKPMIEHYETHSYVTAPIMPDGRVIGFLNADKAFQHPVTQPESMSSTVTPCGPSSKARQRHRTGSCARADPRQAGRG